MEDLSIRAKKKYGRNFENTKKRSGVNNLSCFSSCLMHTLFLHYCMVLRFGVIERTSKKYEQIERVCTPFGLYMFVHVRNKTPNDVIYGELDRCPLFISATVRFIQFCLRLCSGRQTICTQRRHK